MEIVKKEADLMTDIRCTVRNCHYWDDDVCTADKINVATDQDMSVAEGAMMEIGEIGEETKKARTSPQTQCVTFRPKGS